MESRVKADLDGVDDSLESLRMAKGVEVFNLDQQMLERCASLSYLRLDLKPFDQAILAAILVRAEQLRSKGVDETDFCELDSDLQPWDRIATLNGNWPSSITKLESPCTETSC
jgi:hypothetical protein